LGEVRIKVLAAGTGFTDTFIRRGRYPDFKWASAVYARLRSRGCRREDRARRNRPREGQLVADLCVVGGYAQYAIRPARFLVPVPNEIDPAEAVCIPLAYLTAFQMLTRCRRLPPGATILVIGASGTVGTANATSALRQLAPAQRRTRPRLSVSARWRLKRVHTKALQLNERAPTARDLQSAVFRRDRRFVELFATQRLACSLTARGRG
jgi:hypothetical protein